MVGGPFVPSSGLSTARGLIANPVTLAQGESAIWADDDSNDSKVTAQTPKAWQSMTVDDSAK